MEQNNEHEDQDVRKLRYSRLRIKQQYLNVLIMDESDMIPPYFSHICSLP